MTTLSVLIPDATINYVTNPAFRFDTTGWNVQNCAMERSLEEARFGIASLKVTTFGSVTREGVRFRVSVLSGISDVITASAYVRGTGKVRIRLDDNVVGGTEFSSQRIKLDPDRWQRISVMGFTIGGNDLRLFVETFEDTPVSRVFYIDGCQMERKPYATTYCDGDQPGCQWVGTYHNSLSERGAFSRLGGRWIQLAGEDREAEDLYITMTGGLGLPQTGIQTYEFTVNPGGFFASRKVLPRLMTFTFHAKHKVGDVCSPVSLDALHSLRQLLIDLFNPDSGTNEDVWFCYDDGFPLYFQARYDGGLEGDWDLRNQFVNSFPLRVLATNPYMVEDNQNVQVLDFQETVGQDTFSEIVGRIDGEWNSMNSGVENAVGDMEPGAKGELFIGGSFHFVNYGPEAIDPFLEAIGVAYWDGTQWRALPVQATGGVINDIAVAPNGYVYATGVFTSIGGVAASNVAYFDGTAWNAMGAGLPQDGFCIYIDPSGIVYVGGRFSMILGAKIARNIAKWNGLQWDAIGQWEGVNDEVFSITGTPDGSTIYLGGEFSDEGTFLGSTIPRIARYDVATDRFHPVGEGFNGQVNEVLLGEGETLYAAGTFTLSGVNEVTRIAKFQGGAWITLGEGVNAPVYSFDIGVNGDIIAVGEFTMAGSVEVREVALWNGSTWTNLDIDIAVGNSGTIPLAVQYAKNGDVFLGGVGFYPTATTHSAINYVENSGDAEAEPVVYILGPGRVRWFENQTTKKRVFFDLLVLDDEEVFIDFARGVVFSTQRGNLFHSILPGSDFRSFKLAPGVNKLAVYMTNDVNAQMQISYRPTHWGADAGPVALL